MLIILVVVVVVAVVVAAVVVVVVVLLLLLLCAVRGKFRDIQDGSLCRNPNEMVAVAVVLKAVVVRRNGTVYCCSYSYCHHHISDVTCCVFPLDLRRYQLSECLSLRFPLLLLVHKVVGS